MLPQLFAYMPNGVRDLSRTILKLQEDWKPISWMGWQWCEFQQIQVFCFTQTFWFWMCQQQALTVKELVAMMIFYIPQGSSLNLHLFCTFWFCFASFCFHSYFLKKKLHKKNKLCGSHFFTVIPWAVKDLDRDVVFANHFSLCCLYTILICYSHSSTYFFTFQVKSNERWCLEDEGFIGGRVKRELDDKNVGGAVFLIWRHWWIWQMELSQPSKRGLRGTAFRE